MRLERNRIVVLVLLAAILAAYFAVTFTGFYGPVGPDEQYYSLYGHVLATQGFRPLMNAGIDSLKYFVYGGIALFFKLLGASNFTDVLYDAILYGISIIILFIAGSRLKDYRTGLMAAVLYAFFPLGINVVSGGGDDPVMAFFAALSMLMLVYAIYSKSSRLRYSSAFLAGFVAMLGILSISEEVLDLLPIVLVLVFVTLKSISNGKSLGYFKELLMALAGIVVAVIVILAFSYFAFGNPFYVPTAILGWYSPAVQQNLVGLAAPSPIYGLIRYTFYMFPIGSNSGVAMLGIAETGFYLYFAVIAGIFALVWKDKKAAIPALWLVSIFLYLCFGTMSLSKYLQINRGIPEIRYLMIMAPSLALFVAVGLTNIFEHSIGKGKSKTTKRHKNTRKRHCSAYYAGIAILVIFFALVVANDVVQIISIKLSMYYFNYPFYNLGKFLDMLPQGSTILTVEVYNYTSLYLPLYAFTNYKNNLSDVWMRDVNCTVISKYGYFVTITNNTLSNECGLTAVYVQPPYPSYLLNHTLFHFYNVLPGVTTKTTYTVYKTR